MVKDKAQAAKDKGNEAFKAGDYPTAIGHYTEAILADRSDPTYPLNRAAAYLKLGKNEDAERDTTTVLKSSERNVKALFRRAQARIALRKLLEARKDLSDALLIEPSNVAAQEEMKNLSNLIQQETAKKSKNPVSIVQPVSAPYRRRVPIKIIDPSGKVLPTTTAEAASVSSVEPSNSVTFISPSASSVAKTPSGFLEAVSSRSLNSSSIAPPEPITLSSSEPKDFADTKAVRERARPSLVGGGIFRASGESTIFTKKDHIPQSINQTPADYSSPEVSDKIDTRIYEAPSNLFDFTKIWESITLTKERWLYFNTIQPVSLPKLCQTSLEPSLLVSILHMFVAVLSSSECDAEVKQRVLAYMDSFAKVPRFGTVVLFLSKAEKDVAKRVWDLLGIDKLAGVWGSVA